MAARGFTLGSFAVRWFAVAFTSFATYNPSGYSYWHWIADGTDDWPLKYFVGTLLFAAYVIFVRATVRSIGPIGIAIALGVLMAAAWALIDHGWVDTSVPGITWVIVLVILSTLLAIGVSWSHIRTRLSGQVDSNPVG